MAAVSARWNSGRLVSISPTVSPRLTPSAASPAAMRRTPSAYSDQVTLSASALVRRATLSPNSAAVAWKAAGIVDALRPGGLGVALAVVSTSIHPFRIGPIPSITDGQARVNRRPAVGEAC